MMFNTKQIANLPWFRRLKQQVIALQPPLAEDSIALRFFVQCLVITGIIATDIAVGVAEDAVPMSFWAVPLSIIGAIFSWYHRYDVLRNPVARRNIILKFSLAVGMLGTLFLFFGNLIGSLNDTRVILSQLLIQLQVLHSFDIPCRKDLGYSMVIGLILLGVAGSLSQTMAFGPVLLVFLFLAIPTLILEYRSRLGLVIIDGKKGKKAEPKKSAKFITLSAIITPKFFSFLVLFILGLGLTIFLLMPRLPGYQLRSFPVSAPIDFKGDFNGRNIKNPGYIGQGDQDGKGAGIGRSRESGPGELDKTFYYGFNEKMNQNLRGEGLTPQVLMRVRSQSEGFWRVLAFDRYTGQGWEISRNDLARTITRPSWSFRFDIWEGLGFRNLKKEVIQSYTVVNDMPNLIPALTYPREVYFPTEKIAIDDEGSLRSPVDLREGLTYTIISEVPIRDRSILNKASTKYPPGIKKYYLEVPPAIKDKVQKLTEEILLAKNRVAKSDRVIESPYEKALYLAQYLKQNPNYKLQKTPPFLGEKEDLVEAFLFGYKGSKNGEKITGGYGDHFATVYTIMLRSIGIPARLVVGFDPGEFNPFTGLYVVKNTDAHAMTEVFFPGYGWFTFNPIPGYPLIPPSVEDNQTFSALKSFWSWVASWLPTPMRSWLDRFLLVTITAIVNTVTWFLQLFSKGWSGILTGAAILSGLGFITWLLIDSLARWNRSRYLKKLPPIESLYLRMLDTLKQRGYAKHPAQTPGEYARKMRQFYSDEMANMIEAIAQNYARWRYGKESVPTDQFPLLEQYLKKLKKGK